MCSTDCPRTQDVAHAALELVAVHSCLSLHSAEIKMSYLTSSEKLRCPQVSNSISNVWASVSEGSSSSLLMSSDNFPTVFSEAHAFGWFLQVLYLKSITHFGFFLSFNACIKTISKFLLKWLMLLHFPVWSERGYRWHTSCVLWRGNERGGVEY